VETKGGRRVRLASRSSYCADVSKGGDKERGSFAMWYGAKSRVATKRVVLKAVIVWREPRFSGSGAARELYCLAIKGRAHSGLQVSVTGCFYSIPPALHIHLEIDLTSSSC